MRTNKLINLLAHVRLEQSFANTAMQYLDGLTDEHKLELVVIAEQLQAFGATLDNCIEVNNCSFLIDPDHAESLADKLNKKGFDFRIPVGDGIRTLLLQLHNADFTCAQQCAAEFICKMVNKGYDHALTPDELQAVNSCLVLVEDNLDLS